MKKNILFLASLFILPLVIVGCSTDDNVVSSTKSYQIENLLYDVPSSFVETDMHYHWDDVDGERKNSCDFNVSTVTSLGMDAARYAYSNISYMELDGNTIETFTKTINGEVWSVAEVTKEKSKYSSYAIEKNGIIYILKYDDVGSGNVCGQAFDTIFNSLKFN